jgi:hypothetical protein
MLMGQLEKSADGKSTRKYKVELTPEGSILLNGADMTALRSVAGGGKTPAPVQNATPVPAPETKPAPPAAQ